MKGRLEEANASSTPGYLETPHSLMDQVCFLIMVSFTGDVAVKILKVVDPTPEQFQAFRNEVAVLR